MSYNTVSVTTSATRIIPVNAARNSFVVCNTNTTNDLYVGQDSNVTTSNGLFVAKSGGSFAQDASDNNMWLGDIWGIAGGTIDVRYWETTRG